MSSENIEQVAEDMVFVSASPAMRELRTQANLLSQIDAPLLIVGQSDSGKQVAARLIHNLSVRSGFQFLRVNCSALPAISWKASFLARTARLWRAGRACFQAN